MDKFHLVIENGFSKPVLIELHDEEGAHWGVSFNGPNPEPKDFVACSSSDDACRLMNFLNCAPMVRLEEQT